MKILTDLHTHTIATTHAYSTILENTAYAAKNGIEAIAMTDHAPNIEDGAHRWHFYNLRVLPEYINGVRVLKGAEVNVADISGNLDLREKYLESLDWVIVSYHPGVFEEVGTKSQRTDCYIKILYNPYTDMLGHCGNPCFDFDIGAVLDAAKANDKIIEINETSFMARSDNISICRNIAVACAEKGVKISVDSDAHFCESIGHFPKSIKMLEEIGFPEELIVNANWERLSRHLNNRKNGKKV